MNDKKQKTVKVKFLKLPPELLHNHDGKVCAADSEMELPEDLADFVVDNKKAVFLDGPATAKTAAPVAAAAAKN